MNLSLGNHLYAQNDWEIFETRFDPDQQISTGSNFMFGNGYMGYRGTFAEAEAEHYAGCFVSDTYDKADGKWRELCNVPNPLFTELWVNGQKISGFNANNTAYERRINLKHALFQRKQDVKLENGHQLFLREEKFASYYNLHLLAMSYQIRVDYPTEIEIRTGIDGRVWSLHGDHLGPLKSSTEKDLLIMEGQTPEFQTDIVVVEGIELWGKKAHSSKLIESDGRIQRQIQFQLNPGEEILLEKLCSVYHSNDLIRLRERPMYRGTLDPRVAAIQDVVDSLDSGYLYALQMHQQKWELTWDKTDIQIKGNPVDQIILRFNLYHNLIHTPVHAPLPVGARGLSCQVYQGAAFWDQEIFNLPMYLYTQPEMARNLLHYRYLTLEGARKKARDLGYKGAFYAWVSGKTGEELCPSYFFKDLLSGRKIRNHFNDWQIHISPDIAYAVWKYVDVTGDWEFMAQEGAEILWEVARFLYSHCYFKPEKERYEFLRLQGPDEYHENVNNNAYTNYLAAFVLEKALWVHEALGLRDINKRLVITEKMELEGWELIGWQDMVDRLYLPAASTENKLIPQFDDYFDLEDILPAELAQRLIDPDEYWGWPNGIAVETQVLKQADLIQLFGILDQHFDQETMRANYEYYAPRTQHGSSLSPSAYALVAAQIGKTVEAYDLFRQSCSIDLHARNKAKSGGTFIGGIHTAACGAAWIMMVRGFAGFKSTATEISFEPKLPEAWEEIAFPLVVHHTALQIRIDHKNMEIASAITNEHSIRINLNNKTYDLVPGDQRSLSLSFTS